MTDPSDPTPCRRCRLPRAALPHTHGSEGTVFSHEFVEPASPEPEKSRDMDELVSGVPQNVSPKEVGAARAAKSVRTESEKKSVKQELPNTIPKNTRLASRRYPQ